MEPRTSGDDEWSRYLTSIGIPADDKYAKPLGVRQTVQIQNSLTKQWDRVGRVLQVLPQRRYLLSVYDTGCTVTVQRRFLKLADAELRREMFQAPLTGGSLLQAAGSSVVETAAGGSAANAKNRVAKSKQSVPATRSRSKKMKGCLLLRQLRPFNSPGLQEE